MCDDTKREPWGRIQRLSGPQPHLLVFEIYHFRFGKRRLIYDAYEQQAFWIEKRLLGQSADSFVRRMRKLLVGAQLARVETNQDRQRIRFIRNEVSVLLSENGYPVLRSQDGQVLAARQRLRSCSIAEWQVIEPEDLKLRFEDKKRDVHHDELCKRLETHRKRLERKLKAITSDAHRATEAPALRHKADLITAHLANWDPQKSSLKVKDWATDSPQEKILEIDPTLGALKQAERFYNLARRFERGSEIAHQRAISTSNELLRLQDLLCRVKENPTGDFSDELTALRIPKRQSGSHQRKNKKARIPYRKFLGHNEQLILVGRSAKDNEILLQHAKPHDYWLHVRGIQGSHVVVPLTRKETINPQLLLDAALLAVHFSKAHNDVEVEVQHTTRRYIRKPKGSPLGSVRIDREKVLIVYSDKNRLKWLLNRDITKT